jgi:hypothetical protein
MAVAARAAKEVLGPVGHWGISIHIVQTVRQPNVG